MWTDFVNPGQIPIPARPSHFVIVPAREMHLDELQTLLAATRGRWFRVIMGEAMITFDQLRSALLDLDPPAALDRLVRAELTAGRKTKAIYDELIGHIYSVRAMPEYTEAIEDRL